MKYIVGTGTHAGTVKNVNEDAFSVKVINTEIGRIAFAVVCDGMGGLTIGEVASGYVIRHYEKWLMQNLPQMIYAGTLNAETLEEQWSWIAVRCGQNLYKYSAGTTVTILLIAGVMSYIFNIGDTRVYRIRTGLEQITTDHTAAELLRNGLLTEEDIKGKDPERLLAQCIGATPEIAPDFYSQTVNKGDVFLICSDGFRHKTTNDELYTNFHSVNIHSNADADMRVSQLISLNMERHEEDNITAVVIKAC